MLLLTEVRPVFEFPFLVPLSVPGPRLGGHIPLVTTSPQAPGAVTVSQTALVSAGPGSSRSSEGVRTQAWAPGAFLTPFQWTAVEVLHVEARVHVCGHIQVRAQDARAHTRPCAQTRPGLEFSPAPHPRPARPASSPRRDPRLRAPSAQRSSAQP